MTDDDHDELVRITRTIAPELVEVPVYLLDVPGNDHGSLGVTGPDLDLAIRDIVPWRGRGIGIMVDFAGVEAAGLDVLGVLVHELGHALAEDFLSHIHQSTPMPMPELLASAMRLFTPPTPPGDFYASHVSRIHHGRDWVRVCLHLANRLRWRCDAYASPASIFASVDVPAVQLHHALLRPTNDYVAGDGLTFAEIMLTPAPADFLDLFRSSCTVAVVQTTIVERTIVMTSILDQLRDAKAQEMASVQEQFTALAEAILDEHEVEFSEAQAICAAANKDPDDLAAKVAEIKARRKLHAKVQAGAVASDDRSDALAALAHMDQGHEEACRKHHRDRLPFLQRIEQADVILRSARSAKDELMRTAPPELHARKKELLARTDMLARRRHELQRLTREGGSPHLRSELQQVDDELTDLRAETGEIMEQLVA